MRATLYICVEDKVSGDVASPSVYFSAASETVTFSTSVAYVVSPHSTWMPSLARAPSSLGTFTNYYTAAF
jgi:hypothetical protein